MWIPALVGLLALTSVFDYAAARNFALILYSLFALVIVAVTDLRNSYRRWFIVTVGGSTVALVIAFAGKAGRRRRRQRAPFVWQDSPSLSRSGSLRSSSWLQREKDSSGHCTRLSPLCLSSSP